MDEESSGTSRLQAATAWPLTRRREHGQGPLPKIPNAIERPSAPFLLSSLSAEEVLAQAFLLTSNCKRLVTK